MPRPEPQDIPVEVNLSTFFWVLAVIGSLLSCGLVAPLLWITSRLMFPRVIDADGVTRRDGKRFEWDDATGIVTSLSTETGKRIPGTTVAVRFGKDQVTFNPAMLEPRADIEAVVVPALAQIQRRLGLDAG